MSRLGLGIAVLAGSALIAFGQEGPAAAPGEFPSLDSVKWADMPVDREALRGKGVVVLVYGMDSAEPDRDAAGRAIPASGRVQEAEADLPGEAAQGAAHACGREHREAHGDLLGVVPAEHPENAGGRGERQG